MFVPSGLFEFFLVVFYGFRWKQGKTRYSSINHVHVPLIVLGLSSRPITDELGLGEMQLTAPVRLDPPVDVEHLVVARPADLDDPAVDDARGVVFKRKGYGLGFRLLLPDGLRLLQPLGRASGVTRCVLDADTHRRAGDGLGEVREQSARLSEVQGRECAVAARSGCAGERKEVREGKELGWSRDDWGW